MALYSEGSYENVLAQLTDGLSWSSRWSESWSARRSRRSSRPGPGSTRCAHADRTLMSSNARCPKWHVKLLACWHLPTTVTSEQSDRGRDRPTPPTPFSHLTPHLQH